MPAVRCTTQRPISDRRHGCRAQRAGPNGHPLIVDSVMASDTCSVVECGLPVKARGWCNKHWYRWRKTGDPLGLHHPTWGMTTEDRLNYYTDKTGDCWLFSTNSKKGYGMIWDQGQAHGVHRIAYELWVGPIADGMEIDHLCRTRNCVNPVHLEQVTSDENKRRAAH